MNEYILDNLNAIQAIGFLAFVIGLYAFSRTNDKGLKIGQAIQSYVLSIHFYLMGADSASAISMLAGVRNTISLFSNIKNIAPLFILIYILVGFYSYTEPINILPVCSALLGTTAVFYFSGIKMRLLMMTSTSLWIIHNSVLGSIGPLIMEIFILVVTAKTTIKMWVSGR